MLYRFRDKFQRTRFNLFCRNIMHTPPLRFREAQVCFVSEVSHRDITMYLLAIKSLYQFLDGGRIIVLDDGSLTSYDLALMRRHLPFLRLLHIRDVPRGDTPIGGTWERLLTIADLVREFYVIQVDSDSLTLREIPEVLNYVTDNCSFTLLGKGSFPAIESMPEACNRAKLSPQRSMEPQAISERSLEQFPNSAELNYVRGCSAFAGFARGSFNRDDVEHFSRNMEVVCGSPKWHEWGSEQVTSNLIVANSSKAGVLPFPKYASYHALPGIDYGQFSFIHFMGGHRFENDCYSTFSRHVISRLMSGVCSRAKFEQPAPVVRESGRGLLSELPCRDASTHQD